MSECLDDFDLPKTLLADVLVHSSDAGAALCALVAAHRRDYLSGNVLKLEGDEAGSVFLVLSGWLLASKSLAGGQRQIVDVILPGGMLHPLSADLSTSALDVETLTDSRIALIPWRDWRRASDAHPELAELSRKANAASNARIAERVLRLGKAPAETMIGFVLCELCLRSSGESLVDGAEFHVPMTQQQLGDVCGLSAVHVCRTLRRLERNEVLSVTDHMDVVVHDMEALAQIAEIDIDMLRGEIIAAA